MMYIYKITNKLNGKVYIGQTVRSVKERYKEHCRKSTTVIDKAIKGVGKENFTVETIAQTDSIEELNELEKYYIKHFDSINPQKGYNQCEGGENSLGYHHREETKELMRKRKEGMYFSRDNPFYGKHHSKEQREKWSKERKGREISQEWRNNLSKSHYKKVMNVTTGEIFESVTKASESVGAPATHITRVCKGKRKHCRGYEWQYC